MLGINDLQKARPRQHSIEVLRQVGQRMPEPARVTRRSRPTGTPLGRHNQTKPLPGSIPKILRSLKSRERRARDPRLVEGPAASRIVAQGKGKARAKKAVDPKKGATMRAGIATVRCLTVDLRPPRLPFAARELAVLTRVRGRGHRTSPRRAGRIHGLPSRLPVASPRQPMARHLTRTFAPGVTPGPSRGGGLLDHRPGGAVQATTLGVHGLRHLIG
jgi:hypothetical protein